MTDKRIKGYNGLHCFECGDGHYTYDFDKQVYVCNECGDEIE